MIDVASQFETQIVNALGLVLSTGRSGEDIGYVSKTMDVICDLIVCVIAPNNA